MKLIDPKIAETNQYLGEFPNVTAVRNFDRTFLASIGGSFEDIADRIKMYMESGENYDNIRYNGDLYIVQMSFDMNEKGMHPCIFDNCPEWEKGLTFVLKNKKTKKELHINSLIEHMARDHYFLEKVKHFGITAQEFYEHFMHDN